MTKIILVTSMIVLTIFAIGCSQDGEEEEEDRAGIWRDDFDDGNLNGWNMATCLWAQNLVTPDSGNWVVENGAVAGGDDDVSTRYDLYTGDTSWTDYVAEVSIKLMEDLQLCPHHTGVWLGVRGQEGDKLGLGSYALGLVNAYGVESAEVLTYDDGQFSDIQRIAFPVEVNTWYRLKMEVSGDQIRAYVDDTMVGEYQSDRFTSGPVIIGANGIRAMFDDLEVTGIGIPDGGPGF
jgi:pectate lyase